VGEQRKPAVRRRRAAVAGAAAVALVAGMAVGGNDPDAPAPRATPAASATPAPLARTQKQARAAVDRLPLTRQVGRLVVLRFDGTSTPGYAREAVHAGRAAGAILFRDNVTNLATARRLASQLRRGAVSTPIICVDQEGGEVRILPWAAPARSAPAQEAAGRVRADSAAAGRQLRAAGINVVLAPVADVPSVSRAAVGGRAFSRDPARAAAAVAEAVRGFRAGGVAPTAKHFPGLGGATVNTDFGSSTVPRGADEIRRVDLEPFRAAIRAGVPLVMVGHARYPALDRDRIASQSPAIVTGLLRRKLGFGGVVITDSTEAKAVQAVTGVEAAAVRNVRAGVDVVLTTGRGSYIHVYRALLAEARRDPEFRARVRESAARVLALQDSLR
jgi:beta-N-acetylhexosaminidase